jgi:transcriptional regulator GlxA family with amidase domain
MKRSTVRIVGFAGFDGITALDLVGTLEAFAAAAGEGPPRYACRIYGLTGASFSSESGVSFQPHAALDEAPRLDTLVIPGGSGLRDPAVSKRLVQWIRSRARTTRRIASVCTGIYALAATGLLDGRSVTTHWRFAADVARRFPALRMEADSLFIRDGKFFTSAGVTAGIDLALALIEADHGARLALSVARELVVYLKRNGGQQQYSAPLQLQARAPDPLNTLTSWIAANLDQPLGTEALAQRAHLSVRQLHRRFRSAFGCTPADIVDRLRMDAARDRLCEASYSIEGVARAIGYRSADVFRRVFARHFGVSPSDYRQRFVVAHTREQRQ